MQKEYIISPESTVRQAIERMTENLLKGVVITDNKGIVLGIFTNGDMRSFFLQGGLLSANIRLAMNTAPFLYKSIEEVMDEREKFERVIYPIVDQERRLIDVIDFNAHAMEQTVSDALSNIPLVIMAGGKGTRLYPYTKILPKPLIPIGDVTITERIIKTFQKFGCNTVYMILNHKANMIKAYMSDITKDYDVRFVDEIKFQGTGGGLQLLKGILKQTFILSNCDTLLNADLECAYLTHRLKGNKITFICAMKDYVVPYGVIETDTDGNILEMREKPDYSFLVNTGVYIIEPDVIDFIEPEEYIGLPDLAQRMMAKGYKVGVFPIPEKAWMDMGQFSEMENMMKSLGIK